MPVFLTDFSDALPIQQHFSNYIHSFPSTILFSPGLPVVPADNLAELEGR